MLWGCVGYVSLCYGVCGVELGCLEAVWGTVSLCCGEGLYEVDLGCVIQLCYVKWS